MTGRPERLNAVIPWLFIVGATCFVLGSVPAYLNAVGGWVDGVTYVVGSIFFTSASYCQLVQAQSPATTDVHRVSQLVPTHTRIWGWLPHDRSAHRCGPVPRPLVSQPQHRRGPDPQRDRSRSRSLRLAT